MSYQTRRRRRRGPERRGAQTLDDQAWLRIRWRLGTSGRGARSEPM